MDKINTFEDLECWKMGVDIRKLTTKYTALFPIEEKYRLCDQMIRCSRSVTNNIAEGYGRFHYLENAKFCRNSRGSLYELIDHYGIAEEAGYIKINELVEIKQMIISNITVLNGYINYLVKKSKEENKKLTNQ